MHRHTLACICAAAVLLTGCSSPQQIRQAPSAKARPAVRPDSPPAAVVPYAGVRGVLVTQPRPAARHARAASRLSSALGPYDLGGAGAPGGWIILIEPELHLTPKPWSPSSRADIELVGEPQ